MVAVLTNLKRSIYHGVVRWKRNYGRLVRAVIVKRALGH